MITFEDVTKQFPDGTVAVDRLNLVCPDKKITVLVGSSGCGKTTSLRMINRMIESTGGRILVQGEENTSMSTVELRRRIGYVIQQAGLFPHRTVLDNAATVLLLLGTNKRKARAQAMELLERVGLPTELAKRYPYQLSGGQQQRVGVARALAADPPILLMDEPFSAVDPVVRAELQQELLRLQSELAKTIVFVTHDIDEAIRLGDQVAVFRTGGYLVQCDDPKTLLAHPRDEFVASFLGVDRGIRRLSFFDTKAFGTSMGGVVSQSASVAEVQSAIADASDGYLLVINERRHPIGWMATVDAAVASPDDPSRLLPLGPTFILESSSLRNALDSAVLSPNGRAIAVDGDGVLVGTIPGDELMLSIRNVSRGVGEAPDRAVHVTAGV